MAEKTRQKLMELEQLMKQYDRFGATDTEPEYHLRRVTHAGQHGEPFPLSGENPWELYSSMRGWQEVSTILTNKAREYWKALIEQKLDITIAD